MSLTFFTNWQNLGDPRHARVIQISIEDCLSFRRRFDISFSRSRFTTFPLSFSRGREIEREREKSLFLSHLAILTSIHRVQLLDKHRSTRERKFRSRFSGLRDVSVKIPNVTFQSVKLRRATLERILGIIINLDPTPPLVSQSLK